MELAYRIGQFFLFVGLIMLLIFCASDQALSPAYGYFCWGVFLLAIGIFFIFRNRQPAQPSGRFRILKKKRDKQKQS